MSHRMKRILIYLCVAVLLAVIGYSLYRLISIQRDYRLEQIAHKAALMYKPELPPWADEAESSVQNTANESAPVPDPTQQASTINESIVRLRQDYPAAVGWITVPGTDVDYPFVQGPDNQYYLRRGLDGAYLYAGVPFLDSRCAADFSDGNTILYGHNLRNGSMFGSLDRFKSQSFLEQYRYFYIFLEDRSIQVEILACLVVVPDADSYLYQISPPDSFLSSCIADARAAISDVFPTEAPHYVTLSTCDYEQKDGRVVLVGRIVE